MASGPSLERLTIQQGSSVVLTYPRLSKNRTVAWCNASGASSRPYTGAISSMRLPEGRFRPSQGSTNTRPRGRRRGSD
eukprot:3130574-Pyramimonas_sp.AAC.1